MIFKKIILAGCVVSATWGLGAMESKPHLVLDLDEVFLHKASLLFDPSIKITPIHESFVQKFSIVQSCYGTKYMLAAYTPEFLKFAQDRFIPSFFSSALEERNRSVIKDMWKICFATSLDSCIRILSDDDMTEAARGDAIQPKSMKYYGSTIEASWIGLFKKDISKVGPINNTVFVDDDKSYVCQDQLRNFLHVTHEGFDALSSIYKFYKGNRFKEYIDSYLSDEKLSKPSSLSMGDKQYIRSLFAFYKLLYVAGVLDAAQQHPMGIVEGLYEIQFKEGMPNHINVISDITYYKRGYKVLSQYSDEQLKQHFPEIEQYFYD